jgi:hypothetical protein
MVTENGDREATEKVILVEVINRAIMCLTPTLVLA